MRHHSPQGQLVVGIFILAIGVLALIDNLNLFSVRNVLHFWPTVFIAVGVLKLRQSINGKQRLWPIFFIALGSLMTLDNMGVIHFTLRDWWPVLLIVVGIKIAFFERKKMNKEFGRFVDHETLSDGHLDITAILGGNESNVVSQDFRMGDITAVLGGAEVDFRQANIIDQAMLDVTAVMGGVVLKIPRDWIVVNQISSLMGGVQDKSMPMVDARKRLVITGTTMMGGIEIKN